MKKKIVIPLMIVLIVFSAVLFYRFYIYYPDITIKVTALYDEHFDVVQCDNEYFILSDGKIINAHSKDEIYNVKAKNTFIKSYDNLIWIFENNSNENLKAIDKNGNLKKHYLFPGDITDFLINDNVVFALTSDELKMYRLMDDAHLERIDIDYSLVFHSDENRFNLYKYSCEYGECLFFDMENINDNDAFYATDNEHNEVIGACENNTIDLLSYGKDRIFYTRSHFNLETMSEYSFKDNIENNRKLKFGKYARGFFQRFYSYYNAETIVLIAQTISSRSFAKEARIYYSDEMKKHDHDYIVIIDKNDFEVKDKKTKTFERILYANSEKAITYYKGKYLTYSLNDWKVTDKQSASEIKEGGSYNFVSCGEYIFVFDNASGELLNKIPIN
jgi:hypothetical protein